MTASLRCNILAQLGWTWHDHVDASPTTDANRLQFQQNLTDDATQRAEAVWHAENQVLADGASTTLDLSALERALFGDTLVTSLLGVRAILIVNRGETGGALLVGGATSDEWREPFGAAGDRVKVMPGGALLLGHPRDGWQVAAGATDLKLEASGGVVTYDVAIVGTTSADSSSSSGT